MTEQEFLDLYRQRLEEIVSSYKQDIKDNSHIDYIQMRNKVMGHGGQISHTANLLISELLIENNLNPNQLVPQGLTLVTLASNLLLKSFSIQLEINKNFDEFTKPIITKAYFRDHPQENN